MLCFHLCLVVNGWLKAKSYTGKLKTDEVYCWVLSESGPPPALWFFLCIVRRLRNNRVTQDPLKVSNHNLHGQMFPSLSYKPH